VVERPVNSSVEPTEAANEFALARLRQSVQKCRFEQVLLEYEPVAAAQSYEQQLRRDELILVGDFSGGTSDFSILLVGSGPAAGLARGPFSAIAVSLSQATRSIVRL